MHVVFDKARAGIQLMKIALLEPLCGLNDLGVHVRHSVLEPLGIEYLSATAKSEGNEVRVFRQRSVSSEEVLEEILRFDTDVLGVSVMAYNFEHALALARSVKTRRSAIRTVFGGYHASACPEIVKDENIDFVVIGEGEKTFVELLGVINSNGDFGKVNGIAYWNAKLQVNEPRARISNLDELPFPSRDRETLRECKIGGLSYPPPSAQRGVCQVVSSRGCNHSCGFCSSPQVWGKQVRWRNARSVREEIEYVHKEFATNTIFFADLTFNLNKRKTQELCEELQKSEAEIHWYAMCRTDNLDKELLVSMKSAGCAKIAYGIDSVCNETLSKIKPGQNLSIRGIRSALQLTSDAGIIVRAYVIIGFPWEDKESLRETAQVLRALPIDDLRISFLAPFPGTPLYEEFRNENLLATEEFNRYTSDEPVVRTRNLTAEQLCEVRETIFREFYRSKAYEMRMKDKVKAFPHLKQSYDEFFDFLHARAVLT